MTIIISEGKCHSLKIEQKILLIASLSAEETVAKVEQSSTDDMILHLNCKRLDYKRVYVGGGWN